MLTIFNSILKPDKRFARAVIDSIALRDWKTEFEIRVAETGEEKKTEFHTMIREMDIKLSEIAKAMAEGYAPKSPS